MKSRRKSRSRFSRFISAAFSKKYRVLSFVVIFALIGGAIYLGTSFASQTPIAYLRNSNTAGAADITFAFGDKGDVPVTCNWDGKGPDGFGVRRPGNVTFYLSETLTPTKVVHTLEFGNKGDIPICGDWNGDKKAGLGVFRPEDQTFYLSDEIKPNAKITKVKFGQKGDIPLACDWNGDGKTDIGVYRPSNAHFYLSYKKLGKVDDTIHFGDAGDQPVCGDWNGDKKAGIGIHRPSNSKFYLSNGNVQRTTGSGASEKAVTNGKRQWNVNYEFVYGNGRGQQVFAGDWNGDGKDTVAVYRLDTWSSAKPAAPKKDTYTCVGTTVKELKNRDECIALLNYAYAGYPALILQQIGVSENANKGGPLTTAPIPTPAAPAPAPGPAAPAPVGTPTLRLGSTGDAVANLQAKLASFGYWIVANGDFNSLTDQFVRDFQRRRGITSDGVVGPQTWAHIVAAERDGWKVSGLGENPETPANDPGTGPSDSRGQTPPQVGYGICRVMGGGNGETVLETQGGTTAEYCKNRARAVESLPFNPLKVVSARWQPGTGGFSITVWAGHGPKGVCTVGSSSSTMTRGECWAFAAMFNRQDSTWYHSQYAFSGPRWKVLPYVTKVGG